MKQFKILLALLLLTAVGISASAQQVTVNLKQVRLVKVLDTISEQTGHTFYHSRPAVDPDRIVSLEVHDVGLEVALDRLFAGTGISYEISGRKIYLRKPDETKMPQTESAGQVRGTVTDASGLPVIGVGVFVKGTTNGTVTDIDGRWSLSVKPSDILVFSSVGYATQERKAVMLERQKEFPYEGHRWFDAVRMGGAKEAALAEGHRIQDWQYLFPIPNAEIERINNPSLLWQNPGYGK